MKSKKKIDNKNFISVYNELIKNESVDGQEDFILKCNESRRYNINQSAVSMALNNTRHAAITLLRATIERFNVSADYLHDGKEPMFKQENDEKVTNKQTNTMMTEEREKFYMSQIERQNKIIENLSKLISETGIYAGQSKVS